MVSLNYHPLEKSLSESKEFIHSILKENNVHDYDLFGTQMTRSSADRVMFFLGSYPDISNKIQTLMINGNAEHEILLKILKLLINKEFGSFTKLEFLKMGLMIILTTVSDAKIDHPLNIVDVELDQASKTVKLFISNVIILLPPKKIITFICSFNFLLEELHIHDSYQYPPQEIEKMLNDINDLTPDTLWSKENFAYSFLLRLGFFIGSKNDVENFNFQLIHILKSIALNLDYFQLIATFFALNRWNDILTTHSKFHENMIIEKKFLNKTNIFLPILSSIKNTGFRIVVGKSRNIGYGTVGVHPATFFLFENSLSLGDQIILEDPFNEYAISHVDSIQGPYLQLDSGDCLRINSLEEYETHKKNIKSIFSLGDLLIDPMDLPPSITKLVFSYSHNLWLNQIIVLASKLDNIKFNNLIAFLGNKITFSKFHNRDLVLKQVKQLSYKSISAFDAIELSISFGFPLHPNWCPKWHTLSNKNWRILRSWILNSRFWKTNINNIPIVHIEGEVNNNVTEILINGEISFSIQKDKLVLESWGYFFHYLFLEKTSSDNDIVSSEPPSGQFNPLQFISNNSKLFIFVDSLFSVSIRAAVNSIGIVSQNQLKNSLHGFYPKPKTKNEFEVIDKRLKEFKIKKPIDEILLIDREFYQNQTKISPDILDKTILRAKHGLTVFKDGLIHLTCINAPLSSFKVREINIDLDDLHSLGYYFDINGKKITSVNQEIKLFPFDIIIPKTLILEIEKILAFINDELEFIYNTKPIFDLTLKNKNLIGLNVIGQNKNFSTGVYGRIIGFNDSLNCLASPLWHLAKGSYCNGQLTDSLVIDYDCLLNFNVSNIMPKMGMIKGIPLFTNLFPEENIINNFEKNFFRNINLRKNLLVNSDKNFIDTISLDKNITFDVKNYQEGIFDIPIDNFVEDINNCILENKIELILDFIDKIKLKVELLRKNSLVEIDQVFNHMINFLFTKNLFNAIDNVKNYSIRCKNCNSFYEQFLYIKCPICGFSIENFAQLNDLNTKIEQILKIITDNSDIALNPANTELNNYFRNLI